MRLLQLGWEVDLDKIQPLIANSPKMLIVEHEGIVQPRSQRISQVGKSNCEIQQEEVSRYRRAKKRPMSRLKES